ncbi:multiple C2 and transmembrane domain-containing protein-like isoform X3 [Portunus trituberculatus]|uniref:multiple C2 and transmembrane domain-containing protein-like isoform X3 n=1 Tax=Portunus trituberculatus TaxID=210409 RepID=UPI001E1D15B2|nr:multiple C2 and transmembrane domain-containing protein-like isoform X3 [Portunus trituberculatus]
MYGIRLNPEGQHVQRGTTTSARDSQSQAGSRQYLGSKRVTENYQYASFTEYNNNEVLSGSSNSSSSLLSERMLPDGGGMLSRSTYSRSTMLSDTRIAHSAIIGSSTMRKETASSSAFSSTVGSRRIMGHTHCSGSTRIPDVYLEAAEGGAECQSVRLQEEEAEFCIGVGSSRENGHQGGAMRRSFSKSANDLLHRTRSPSGERSSEPSPKGSPTLGTRKAKEQDRPRANTQPRPAPSFFTTFKRVKKMAAEFKLKTKFQRTLSKESKVVARRKDVLLDGVRSNSHPDVSVERQDSTTDYAADNSSAEQSSSGTPLTMSPRRGPHLASSRHYSNDPNTLFENGEDPTETESRIMEELPDELLASTEASLEPDTSGAPGESGDQGASIASNFSPPTPARAAHFSIDTASPSYLLGRGTESDTSQQLMLCEGESVTMDAPSPLQASSSTNTTICEVWSKEDPAVQRQRALRQHSFFQLHIHLKRGQDLVARDACGTSDPYVKFKVAGKLAYKSKTVYKDLNPTWDESFTVGIEDPFEPVSVKVFDYDWGLQDDFMGLATIDLTTLDLDKCTDVELPLSEPRKASPPYMGKLYMSLTLQPKTQEEKEQYLQRGGSRLAEQQRRLKSQIWSSVVTIVLVEGKNLLPMDADGTSDPYVKFRLGNEKYKSKADLHTLNPKWLEQFDFHQFEDQSQFLEITVWDKDVRSKDDFMGRCVLDISKYEKEKTHHIWAPLDKGAGSVFILLTISGITSSETISDLHSFDDNPKELANIAASYKWTRTLQNVKDVGYLRVKVFRAQGLASADIGGKSDPFCVLELVNDRLQTQTEYKTLSPSWNKIFNFNVKDIHSILEVTVYDEDRDHKVEFLGKIAIPLLRVRNGEKKWHALKDKKLRMRAKGVNPEILLECTVYWNPLRAAIRTFMPKEEKFMQVEQKFKRQVFITNVNRLKACVMDLVEGGKFIKSCFEWEYPIRSTFAFIGFMVGTYCFEPYMIPIILLIVYLKNYIVLSIVGTMSHREDETDFSVDDDEVDDDEKDKNGNPEVRKRHYEKDDSGRSNAPTNPSKEEEKKSLKERLQAIQEVTATVQNAIGAIASLFESVNNTFNFSVPFLSWLLIIVLIVGTFVLYYIPIRYLVMIWGVNKFTRKLIRPHAVINNELLDFLSRVPDDETLRDCRELRMVAQLHDDKRRDNRKKKQS